jgi:RNA polymerase sigma-70 factor (ECF subfamily)
MAEAEIIELARKASKGNKKAFAELCEKKSRSMVFTALGILGNLEDAEDAAQDAVLTMFKGIGKLKTPEAIDVWIYQVVRSRCLRILEKNAKSIGDLDIDDESLVQPAVTDDEMIPEKYAQNQELGRILYDIILGLPPKRRETIIMFYYDDLSIKEIAAVTGTTINAVTSTLTKAKVMIREQLEENERKEKAAEAALGAGAVPVISRVLAAQFEMQLPEAALHAFNQKWLLTLNVAKFAAAKTAVLTKVATVAVAATTVTSTGLAVDNYIDKSNENLLHIAEQVEYVGLVGDCDCGHLNPTLAFVDTEGIDLDGVTLTWDIKPESSDEVIYSGTGDQVSSEIIALEDSGSQGRYTLTFSFGDKVGNRVEKIRTFEIE